MLKIKDYSLILEHRNKETYVLMTSEASIRKKIYILNIMLTNVDNSTSISYQ